MGLRESIPCVLCLPCLPGIQASPPAQTHPITIHANQRVVSLQMSPSPRPPTIPSARDPAPVGAVTPFDVFRGVSAYDDATGEFEASSRVRFDPARILSERIPSSQTARKDFHLLIVVLCDAPLTAAQWKAYDRDAEAFGKPGGDGTFLYNFWEATGGKGTMETGKLNGAVKGASIFPMTRRLIQRRRINFRISAPPAAFKVME